MDEIISDVFANLFDIDNDLRKFIFVTDHTVNIKLMELIDYSNGRNDYQNIILELMDAISQIRSHKTVYNTMIIVTTAK